MRWIILSLLLAGCGVDTSGRSAGVQLGVWDLLQEAVAGRLRGLPTGLPAPKDVRAALTPEVVAQLPPDSLFAVLGPATSVLRRVAINNGVETYLTEDNITLALRDGVIVATRGLGFDLIEADVSEVIRALQTGGPSASRSMTWLDGEGQPLQRSFSCEYRTIAQGLIEEDCTAIDLGFTNTYRLSEERITASEQWLGPVNSMISLELLLL